MISSFLWEYSFPMLFIRRNQCQNASSACTYLMIWDHQLSRFQIKEKCISTSNHDSTIEHCISIQKAYLCTGYQLHTPTTPASLHLHHQHKHREKTWLTLQYSSIGIRRLIATSRMWLRRKRIFPVGEIRNSNHNYFVNHSDKQSFW